jgi:hypothetical protein
MRRGDLEDFVQFAPDFLGSLRSPRCRYQIIPKRKSHCSSHEGALWASLATRKFQLWHQGGAGD